MTDTTTALGRTYGEPKYDPHQPADLDNDVEAEPATVRWDLAFGACLAFGAPTVGEPLEVSLSISDAVLVDRGLQREVTAEQVRTHALALLRLAAVHEALGAVGRP
jgi:hypothetical protein